LRELNPRAFELACSPSPASITPAFTISSLNFPMASINSLVGRTPASESLLALTIIMNRIVSVSFLISNLYIDVEQPAAKSTGATFISDYF
jgi:hypothetical protein